MSITEPKSRGSKSISHRKNPNPNANTPQLPLVVTLSCIEDNELEQDSLAGVAAVEHVGLNRLADGKIESAAAVLLHSLAFLPRAAQRRLKPWQLILCLGSSDRAVESAVAADLGLRLVHVDVSRAEDVADTVMALMLGLLRRLTSFPGGLCPLPVGWALFSRCAVDAPLSGSCSGNHWAICLG